MRAGPADPGGAGPHPARGAAWRSQLPILLGTAILVLYTALSVPRADSGAGRAGLALWVVALVGIGLLTYGCLSLRHRYGRERGRSRELAVTRAQLEALIDASPLAITAGDPAGRVTLWNQAAERILGWTAEEVVGQAYPAVPAELEEEWGELRRRVLDGEPVHGVRTERERRDGSRIDVSVSAAPVRDDTGAITGTVALVESLNQKEEAAREVEKLESQLRQAQKLEVIGRLAAGIAHDFNNLLTAIRGNAELILDADGNSPAMESDLAEIARSAERAAALTRQLLTFAHQGPVENRPLDVNTLVKGMESLMTRLTGETIELRVELSVDAGSVLMDPNQLEQVLLNLVVNARDALPRGGRITLRTHLVDVGPEEAAALPYEVRPGPFAKITVLDNGVGMDQETADQIFEPFFTTKPVGVGTGLGLSTVYSIVKQARGHIQVETEPGAGAAFLVFIPRHEGEHAPAEPDEPVARQSNGGTETILVVEDEAAVLSLAERTLTRQGYKVLTAPSGREALAIALKHPGEIHVLFCDVVMPDLSGREVAERVKSARPDIQVLMTSGYGEHQLAEDGVLGDNRFLPKPYTPKELAARVRQVLGQPTVP